MSRTYSKILKILSDGKIPSSLLIKKFEEIFGYKPNKQTIYSDLSRGVKDGVLTRDENGFYDIKK